MTRNFNIQFKTDLIYAAKLRNNFGTNSKTRDIYWAYNNRAKLSDIEEIDRVQYEEGLMEIGQGIKL